MFSEGNFKLGGSPQKVPPDLHGLWGDPILFGFGCCWKL